MDTTILPDRNQTFWGLTCIQSAAQSVPGMLIGRNLSQQFGEGTALISICIGNLILWVIGLSIISMNQGARKHAIENVKGYLGKPSANLATVILAAAFITWYVLEIKATVSSLDTYFESYKVWQEDISIRVGVALGLLTALLAIGGIRLIRWTCTLSFPFLFFFLLYMILTSEFSPTWKGTWGVSLSAIISTLVLTLPGFVNLPTFFRHSRSTADSFLALSLITIFDIIFSLSSIFIGFTGGIKFDFDQSVTLHAPIHAFIFFVFLSSICLNLVNIYFASAVGETIYHRRWNSKEYTIIGLLGTAAYAFLQIVFPMEFLGNLTNSLISCLGIALLLAFLVRIVVKHRPRPFEKIVTSTCWYAGSLVALILQIINPQNPNHALMYGVTTSLLIFLLIIFIEETMWAIQDLTKPI